MRRELSAYEVRCPRCDVSFPVGTRRCMHCGGPTGGHGRVQLLESMSEAQLSTTERTTESSNVSGIDPFANSPSSANEEDFDESDRPTSVGRTLFRSFGGLIWVLVLIAFSIARSCGGE